MVLVVEFVVRGVDAILNETQRAGRRSKGLEVQKIYPRLAANGARVATREAREGKIFYRFLGITCMISKTLNTRKHKEERTIQK